MRNAIFRLSLCMKFHLFRLIQLENAQNSSRLVILLTVRNSSFTYCTCFFFIIRVCKVIKLRRQRVEKWWEEELMLYTLNALTNREWLWFGHIPTLTSRKKVEIPFTPGHCQGEVIYIDNFLTFQKLSTGYNIASVASYVHYDPHCQNIFFWRENSSKTKNRF